MIKINKIIKIKTKYFNGMAKENHFILIMIIKPSNLNGVIVKLIMILIIINKKIQIIFLMLFNNYQKKILS